MSWWTRAFGRGAPAPRDVDTALRSALLAVLDRDLDTAEKMLTRALRMDSGGRDSFLALARLYRMRGEIGRAIRIHQNLLLRSDLSSEQRVAALADLASDFRQGGFLRRAIASYEEVLAYEPRHVGALRALMRLHSDVRDHNRAIEMCRRLAKAEGRSGAVDEAALLVDMARVAQAEGRSEDARRAVKRALRKDPRSIQGWVTLGDLEAERSRSKQALAAWLKVIELDVQSGPLVFSKLEATHAALGRPREYEKTLREMAKRNPEEVAPVIALAETLAARGDTELAVEELRAVIDRFPGSIEARSVLGRVLLSEHRDSDAAIAFGELLDALGRKGHFESRETLD